MKKGNMFLGCLAPLFLAASTQFTVFSAVNNENLGVKEKTNAKSITKEA